MKHAVFLLLALLALAPACGPGAPYTGAYTGMTDAAAATGGRGGDGSGGGAGVTPGGAPGAGGSGGASATGTGGGTGDSAARDAGGGKETTGGTGGRPGDGGTDPGTTARCPATPRCDAAAPDPGAARPWRHKAPSGAANHRGRDLFVNPGARQWILGDFHYGLALLESALADEEVDVYLLRGCGATWEKLGSALTTSTAAHETVEGVSDAPGRFYFEIPAAKALAAGRHRVRLVVGGDLSTVDLFIEVVPAGTPLFVTDVDGTLTTSEDAQTLALLTGAMPEANADAAQALTLLAAKGYRPLYLTARPEWLARTTQDWLAAKGFPPGVIHTTLTSAGASGAAAGTYKTDDLKLLAGKGLKPAFAFGNTSTDADAYNNAGVQPLGNRIFFQYTDSAWNGRRIEAFQPLLSEFAALPLVCP
ncbi:MAG TPA: hypothetical protein VNO55_17890 [Polyangia bacterium]|nr:hypothetical protein [Polyangia bacterium]